MFVRFNFKYADQLKVNSEVFEDFEKLVNYAHFTLRNMDFDKQRVDLCYGDESKRLDVYTIITLILPPILFNNHFKYIKNFHNDMTWLHAVREDKSKSTIKNYERKVIAYNHAVLAQANKPSGWSMPVDKPCPPSTNKNRINFVKHLKEHFVAYRRGPLKQKQFKF